jgi:uncharacterized protein YqeY
MSVKERLDEDMKAALKARDAGRERLSVIRMVRAAVKNAEIEKMRPLTDEEVAAVLAREVKQRQDVIPDYAGGGRDDLVAAFEREIAILREYMPLQLSDEEVRRLAREAVSEVGAKDAKDMGKVMGVLMPKVKGKADGRLVSQVVKELLNC